MGQSQSKGKDFAEIAQNSRQKKYGGLDTTFSSILFNLFDRNGDKDIDFQEFCLAYGYLVNRSLDDVSTVSFKCLDLNGDGEVSKNELRSVVMMNKKMEKYVKIHNKQVPLDKITLDPRETSDIYDKADKLFAMLDKNGDGRVSNEEFMTLVKSSPQIQKIFTELLVKDESVDFFGVNK
ncbi:recoverin family protein [Cavenderia fasciculata]|uniref:Recoverin family protein n=1 Tax=Cavenderia fasciculata TaxID=261658 RepID=F4PV36_CACFS|nr:recoverin family protein [Cavenderia fasciculata]EGG21152.1 recoverin family protein [Cavenderia fasciculata]|eukprot:XP_004359002.1 recoverin family protein [Cavenderia fasciculata]